MGCHNETSPTAIANTQMGLLECDTSQRLIVVSPTAGNFNVTATLGAGSAVIGHVIADSGSTTAVTSLPAIPAGTNLIGSVVPWPGTLKSGAVTSAMTGTTSTQVIAAVASNYLYISSCTVSNASTTVSTDIVLQDGSGGTTLWTIPAPAAAVATTGGGGAHVDFPTPLKVPTNGNALYAANVTTGSSTKISCTGLASTVSY
jgi:hypothetical protein